MQSPWRIGAAMASAVLAVSTPAMASPPRPSCPSDTAWDGLGCTHPRVTCGAWDGLTCTPEPHEDADSRIERELATIDRQARAVCDWEKTSVPFGATVVEVLKGADEALAQADRVDRRFADLHEKAPGPRWTVALYARAGSLFDCISVRLASSHPTLFMPKQYLQRLQQLRAAGATQAQVGQIAVQLGDKSAAARQHALDTLARRAIPRYALAAVLARRHFLADAGARRAYERLPAMAAIVGDEEASAILEGMADPTTPEGKAERSLAYFIGVFEDARWSGP